MPLDGEHQDGRVRLRFCNADGELSDTTLDRVADDLVAGLPMREFRSYRGNSTIRGGIGRWRSGGWWSMRADWAGRIMLADFDPAVACVAAALTAGVTVGYRARSYPRRC